MIPVPFCHYRPRPSPGHSRRVSGGTLAWLFAVASVGLVLTPTTPALAGPPTYPDIPFTTLDNGYQITMDVYVPAGEGPFPGVLAIHGSRQVGDKESAHEEAEAFAAAGFVAFTPNYRLVCDPADKPPAVPDARLCVLPDPVAIKPVLDLEQAVLWIRAHPDGDGEGSIWHLDPARIGAFGTSAGGNFATMLATYSTGQAKPTAAVSFSGEQEFALSRLSPKPTVPKKAALYIGCRHSVCPDDWDFASPLYHVDGTSAPTYLANGTVEPIPLQEALDMDAALRAAGVIDFLRTVPGDLHGSDFGDAIVDPASGHTGMDEAISFMRAALDPNAQADLSLTGADGPDPIGAGRFLAYTFTVTNNSPAMSLATILTVPVAGATVVSTDPGRGSCTGTATVTCALGGIPGGESLQVTITVVPEAAGTLSTTATVSTTQIDTVPGNDSTTLVTQVDPDPSPTAVGVGDAGFTPRSTRQALGRATRWTFSGTVSHSVRDPSALALFDSGAQAPGSSFTFALFQAGTYQVQDPATPADGSVKVPISVSPAEGTTATSFTVQWATVSAPRGWVYDVQIRRPLDTAWTSWMMGVTSPSTAFSPDAGAGTYSFRARLHREGTVAVSRWSPVMPIVVTAP
jgi:acetyl esterase/lipase/plastocyanin